MKLTILMPCLNESETIETCILKAKNWISKKKIDAEILIADNGSTDGSQEIARSLNARVINIDKRGYGNAIFYGSMEAKGNFIIMADADDSYDFGNLDAFIDELEKGHDLVMGNRFSGGISAGAMPWKNRYIGNPVLSFVGRVLFKSPINDFHCGIRGFRKNSFKEMDLRTTGMEFASEMVIKASILNMKISEVPTTLKKDGRSREPHLRPWRDGWRHLSFMLLFSPRWLFINPGIYLLTLSTVTYIAIFLGPKTINSITFDIHTLFYIESGIILGILAIAFGTIIKAFGSREGLLKQSASLKKLRELPTFEIGLLISLALIFFGVYIGYSSFQEWQKINFGQLTNDRLLRSVSLSTLFILTGGIAFFSALILGFLNIPTRRDIL